MRVKRKSLASKRGFLAYLRKFALAKKIYFLGERKNLRKSLLRLKKKKDFKVRKILILQNIVSN